MNNEHRVMPEHDLIIGKGLDGRDFLCFGGSEHSVLHAVAVPASPSASASRTHSPGPAV